MTFCQHVAVAVAVVLPYAAVSLVFFCDGFGPLFVAYCAGMYCRVTIVLLVEIRWYDTTHHPPPSHR